MEFFHRATSFPFMSTRKVWYGLSIILILISLVSLAHARPEPRRGLHRRRDRAGDVPERRQSRRRDHGADAPPATPTRRSPSSAASREVAIRLPPTKLNTAEVRGKIEQILHGVDAGATIQQVEVVGPQVGGELQRSAVQALVATLAADLRLYRAALSHLAPVAGRHSGGVARPDPGARHLLAHAHHLRPDRGGGDAGGDRLFAQRYRGGVRSHPRALPHRPAPGRRWRCSINRSIRRYRAPS